MATILVPLDGSKLSEAALDYLPALRNIADFKVTLMHVSRPDEGDDDDIEAYLDRVAKETASRFSIEVDWLHRHGSPDAQILAEVANPWFALLLMCTHGKSGIEPWRLGSVADKVIRGAFCPTLLIGPAAAAEGASRAFKRILVPLDGSRLAEEALPLAVELARRFEASLSLVTAYEPSVVPPVALPVTTQPDFLTTSELAVEQYLQDIDLGPEFADGVERTAIEGHPAEVILAQAAQQGTDLVIMTSHGRHGFVRWALGSVADRLIRGHIPVLVIQPGEGSRLVRLLQSETKA